MNLSRSGPRTSNINQVHHLHQSAWSSTNIVMVPFPIVSVSAFGKPPCETNPQPLLIMICSNAFGDWHPVSDQLLQLPRFQRTKGVFFSSLTRKLTAHLMLKLILETTLVQHTCSTHRTYPHNPYIYARLRSRLVANTTKQSTIASDISHILAHHLKLGENPKRVSLSVKLFANLQVTSSTKTRNNNNNNNNKQQQQQQQQQQQSLDPRSFTDIHEPHEGLGPSKWGKALGLWITDPKPKVKGHTTTARSPATSPSGVVNVTYENCKPGVYIVINAYVHHGDGTLPLAFLCIKRYYVVPLIALPQWMTNHHQLDHEETGDIIHILQVKFWDKKAIKTS